ncbi:hypothetical protein GCWU000341_01778 [Oribacterium sp. oral taxon 078 str. F0262]|nr:hypothetical protein GCWU000341_01778 [Oribacterium sp. oral taxon 078 str. F0262]
MKKSHGSLLYPVPPFPSSNFTSHFHPSPSMHPTSERQKGALQKGKPRGGNRGGILVLIAL